MRDILVKGLAQLGLSDRAVPQLEAYASLLLEKNKVMNLTAITAPQEVATLHLLDCAALLTMAYLRGKRAIDVGTGAGFPGRSARLCRWSGWTASTPAPRNLPPITASSTMWLCPAPSPTSMCCVSWRCR